VQRILKYLNGIPECYAEKRPPVTTFGLKGNPDITGCLRGRRLEIEVKRPGNKPTELQKAMMDRWKAAGAIVFVATSVPEARDLLRFYTDDAIPGT